MTRIDVGIVSVVPSPYQRDLFWALAQRPEVRLSVYYLEQGAPDSPWPEEQLRPYEQILPGFWVAPGGARFHIVTRHPRLAQHESIVLNTLTSSLSQWWLRRPRHGKRTFFWAEALRPQSRAPRQLVQAILTRALSRVDAIVGIGSTAVEKYAERFPGKPVFNIPYYCNLAPFLSSPATFAGINEEVRFLFCGQLIARKGVDILLQAFDRLVRKGLRVRLELVGRRGELDAMLAGVSPAARELVSYSGFQDPKRLYEAYSRNHVFILPSRYDGWGVVINQALGAGLPVICSTTVGSGRDLVETGSNGFLIEPNDAVALATAMERFAQDPTLAVRFGAASRARADLFTPERGAEKWIHVFTQFR
jgi:glycosyltransferase involved in cell wall biosynthesis